MSFLRWAGSKKQILVELSSCWFAATSSSKQRNFRYIEGFSGSASLFFFIQPSRALLVDINAELQHCLNRVKLSPKGVALALRDYKNTEDEYYEIRKRDPAGLKPNERAANFIYLNRNCFNGLYRTNREGKFNVPYGGKRAGRLPDYAQLQYYSSLLANADLLTGDFHSSLIDVVAKNDFLYLDPPYAKRNADLDNQYGPDVFGLRDIRKMGDLLKVADKRGAKFLVSYAACEEIEEIAGAWHTHTLSVRRTIAADSEKRRHVDEILITNI